MSITNRQAFTMIELIFVIILVGIMAAIAVPRLWVTRDDAIVTKGRSDVSMIRSAIATDRQKRMLEGNTTIRPVLDSAAVNTENQELFRDVMQYGIFSKNGAGHWMKTGTNTYVFVMPDSTAVTFTYNNTDGSFDCNHTQIACQELTH